jgi:3',5'-cyclic AMP phosphodiesterase CpdA
MFTLLLTHVFLSSEALAFRFAVLGDSRNGDEIFRRLLGGLSARRDLKFVIHTGDMCPDGAPEEFMRYLDMIRVLKVPVKSVCGNHERHTGPDLYERYLGKAYYSWGYEDCHFTVIDNSRDDLDRDQISWIRRDLATARAKHKYVFCHKPIYSPHSRHFMGEDSARARKQGLWLEDTFQKYGIEMVFAGHVHAYAYDGIFKGVKYYITGGAGAPLRERGNPHFKALHHYLVVDTESGKVDMVPLIGESAVSPR